MKRIIEVNGKKYIREGAKEIASNIKSASKYSEKGIYPLSRMASNIKPELKKGPGVAELKKRLYDKSQYDGSFYVQTDETSGFAVFKDGVIYVIYGGEWSSWVAKSKNWKKDVQKHNKELI